MKLSTQIQNFARSVADGLARPEVDYRINIRMLHGMVERWARETELLEARAESLLPGGKTDQPLNLSEQVAVLAQQIAEQHSAARGEGKVLSINLTDLLGSLNRVCHGAIALEARANQSAKALDGEYVSRVLTTARWVLSNNNSTGMVRELAEAVLVLAGRCNPS